MSFLSNIPPLSSFLSKNFSTQLDPIKASVEKTPALFPDSSVIPANSLETFFDFPFSQKEMDQLRSGIAETMNDFVMKNPTMTLTDIKAQVDNVFGSGISDLFQLNHLDASAGKSVVTADKLNLKDLNPSEKEQLKTAIKVAKENFEEVKKNSSHGQDIISYSFKIYFMSGRYRNATTPSKIAETAALTNSTS